MSVIVSKELLSASRMEEQAFIQYMNELKKDTAVEALEIDYVELSLDRVVLQMPVGPKTRQYAGILHGGASVLLAETAASLAAGLNIDLQKYGAVGLEINANHIRSKSGGIVTAVATPLHKGRRTMVWEVKITDEDDKLVCISRCTVAIVEKG